MDFFGDLGGFFEGGGLVEGFLESFGSIIEHLSGSGRAMEGMQAGARGFFRAESGFARLFELFNEGANLRLDYLLWKDMVKGSQAAWDAMGEAEKRKITELREVIAGHAFIRQQLQAHKGDEKIGAIAQEYEELGMHLPGENLLKKAYRTLAPKLHPDTSKVDEALFRQLNDANEALKNTEKCARYRDAVLNHKETVEKMFKDLGSTNWENIYKKAEQRTRRQLEGPIKEEAYTGARRWFSELKPHQQGALIFAAVTGVGVGTYMLAKALDQREKQHKPKPKPIQPHVARSSLNNAHGEAQAMAR